MATPNTLDLRSNQKRLEFNKLYEAYQQYIDQFIKKNNINISSINEISEQRVTVSSNLETLMKNLKSDELFGTPELLNSSIVEFVTSLEQLNNSLKSAFPNFWLELNFKLQTFINNLYNYFFAGTVCMVGEANGYVSFYRKPRHNVSTFFNKYMAPNLAGLKDHLLKEKQDFEATTKALVS